MMKPEEALTMEKLLNELQSVDTVKLVLTGCGESIYDSREVHEAIRPFVEKQIPKKPDNLCGYSCRACSGRLARQTDLVNQKYCHHCGHKIDWGNENDRL